MITEVLSGVLAIALVLLAVFFLPILLVETTIDKVSNIREIGDREKKNTEEHDQSN